MNRGFGRVELGYFAKVFSCLGGAYPFGVRCISWRISWRLSRLGALAGGEVAYLPSKVMLRYAKFVCASYSFDKAYAKARRAGVFVRQASKGTFLFSFLYRYASFYSLFGASSPFFMKKILVFVNLTPQIEPLLCYAFLFAEEYGAEVHVHHIVSEEASLSEAFATLEAIAERERNQRAVGIEIAVRKGKFITQIGTSVAEVCPDLTLMGISSRTQVEQFLTGDALGEVLDKGRCPLLLVPAEAIPPTRFSHWLYASDFDPADADVLDALLRISNFLHFQISCLHISTHNHKLEIEQLKMQNLASLYWETPPEKLRFHTESAPTVEAGLEAFLATHPTDLMVMLTRERTFLEGLFHKSLTKQMSRQSKTCILMMKI
ncbi:universal stress protein [Hugenholtzia roseola]|uniref:universal stress protein n=1 Tax=Hugenholtzia roseola TaxID=1002 RepID=UPI00047AED74|nr:universal stress protein [Hugenholtzia roseola]